MCSPASPAESTPVGPEGGTDTEIGVAGEGFNSTADLDLSSGWEISMPTVPDPWADAPDTWMKRLNGSTLLTRLSIPGAHDAATSTASSLGKCQALSIAELWDAGVRVFDLRPAFVDEELMIYHGIIATGQKYKDIMNFLLQKLDEYPADFVVVIQRHESEGEKEGTTGWGAAMGTYVSSISGSIAAYRSTLTVNDLRGKMLLLSRDNYQGGPIGGYVKNIIDKASSLSDQQAAWINAPVDKQQPLWCQDYYAPSNANDKWAKLEAMFEATRTATVPYPLVMNNTSGYIPGAFGLVPNYVQNAVNVNARAAEYIRAADFPVGIIMMDFAGADTYDGSAVGGATLVDAVIANNFR